MKDKTIKLFEIKKNESDIPMDKIHLEMDKKRDKLPPVIMYKDYLKRIVNKENITIDEARKKYGQYTINQWNKLLNNG